MRRERSKRKGHGGPLVVQVAKRVCWSLLAGPDKALPCGGRWPDAVCQIRPGVWATQTWKTRALIGKTIHDFRFSRPVVSALPCSRSLHGRKGTCSKIVIAAKQVRKFVRSQIKSTRNETRRRQLIGHSTREEMTDSHPLFEHSA